MTMKPGARAVVHKGLICRVVVVSLRASDQLQSSDPAHSEYPN